MFGSIMFAGYPKMSGYSAHFCRYLFMAKIFYYRLNPKYFTAL